VLSVCTSVENLFLYPRARSVTSVPFLAHPGAGSRIRRLTCTFGFLFPHWTVMQNFHHACFANLTHLHLNDRPQHWTTVGLENLCSLTHLACVGIEEAGLLMPICPALEYVAICQYESLEHSALSLEYSDLYMPRASCGVPIDVYSIEVVWIHCLTMDDWKCGATGRADFWDVVEQEVASRQAGTLVRIMPC
jgi:hypothetical protein